MENHEDPPTIIHAHPPCRNAKFVAVTWGDGQLAVICLHGEVEISSDVNFEDLSITAGGSAIIWPGKSATVTAVRLSQLEKEQAADPLPPSVFATWRACMGLCPETAAKHLAVGVADIKGYESGDRPIPRLLALLCREWLSKEFVLYEENWYVNAHFMLKSTVDSAYEAYKRNKNKNKGLSEAAHILGWIDGKRHSERSISYIPYFYKNLIEGKDGPKISKWEAIEEIRKRFDYPSPEAARQALTRMIRAIKKRYPDETAYDGILPQNWPPTKNS